jgi:heavy metal sensor kinase
MTKRFLRVWPLGVSLQLTLWYCAVFTILLLLFGAVFYVHLSNTLTTNFDDTLRFRMQQIAAQVTLYNNAVVVHDASGKLSALIESDEQDNAGAPGSEEGLYAERYFDVDLDALVRVLGPRGEVEYITPSFSAITAPASSVSQPFHDSDWIGTVVAHNGQEVRLYSAPLRYGGKVFGVVQIAASLAPLEHTLHSILLELLVVAPLAIALGAIGSYWLARRAFTPIERLTTTAATIKAGDLHQRVPVPRANDEVRHLALTFNEMIEYLEKTFTQQRRFIADASHELRTPVAAIRSMTDVALAQDNSTEEYVSVLRDVNLQSERLASLISALFTLTRFDEGHIHFEQEAVSLDQLAIDVTTAVEPLAAERGICVEAQAEQQVQVVGDEARLIQLMMNLLENALTYTDAGGKVTLRVAASASSAYLSVRDTGIGIAPEHIEYVFERFYRADPARSRMAGGTGLGLSIAAWIVRMHRGTISVESQPARGSIFTITLPLSEHPILKKS